ncbi:MAG: transporter related protein, partial [Glaciihabitans sp.]|nr:transporter related protein [Glaciihabitans sp.]
MEILRFVLLGLSAGAIYAILAQGLIVIYRGSGLVNFSQGAIAMAGAYVYYEFTVKQGQPRFLALLIALASCAVIGLVIQLLVLRPMRQSSALARVVATLAITVVLQSLAFLIYGYDPLPVPSLLPTGTVQVFSDQLSVGADTLIIFAIAGAVTIGLAIMYGRTPFGRATAAVAENQLVAASLGHSPTTIATLNWVLGSVLAGMAGVLIAPIIFLEPTVLVLLVVPALAAAMLAEFSSFGLTFALTIGLGIASAQINRWVPDTGWATTAPFLVIVIALTLRGSVLPLRSFVLDRPPRVGDARVRPLLVAGCFGLASLAVFTATPNCALALTINFALAIVCLSSVVIIGYAGQLSLAASTMAGLSAVVAAHMSGHAPFLVVLGLGALAAGCCGALIGIPALRTRGVTLAIATLALSAAISSTILLNSKYNGGADGILVEKPQIFGWDIDPLFHGNRYAFVVLVCLTVIALAVANLRRGRTGRRLLAIRANERASAALGVPTSALKAYAFTLSATIAGVGGVLIGFSSTAVQINAIPYFTVFSGILIVAVTAVGGVGYIGGALMGSTLLAGGIGNELLRNWSGSADYLPLIGGIVLIIT